MTFRCEPYYIELEGRVTPHSKSGEAMRFSRLAAIAGASVLVVGIASCSGTGGKPQESGGGMGGGTADTPRATIAMITHEVPGDSFWDLIRKGAETAAKKDNIELRYSNDPEAPNQANLVQTAVDSGVKGIAVTLAKPDAMQRRGEGRRGQGHPGGGVQRRTEGLAGDGRQGVLRPGRQHRRDRAPATGSPRRAPRRRSASSRSRATSTSRPAAPV